MVSRTRRFSLWVLALAAGVALAGRPAAGVELSIHGLVPGMPLADAVARGLANPAEEETIGDAIPGEYWPELGGMLELGMAPRELPFRVFGKDLIRAYVFPSELPGLGGRLSSVSDRIQLPRGADAGQGLGVLLEAHGQPADAFDVGADFRQRHGKDWPEPRTVKLYLWGARFSRTAFLEGFAGDGTRAPKIEWSQAGVVLIGIVVIGGNDESERSNAVVLREIVDRRLLARAIEAARVLREKAR